MPASAPELSLNQYQLLFATMSEGFFVGEPLLDAAGKPVDIRLLAANEAFYQQTGLSREVLGHPLREQLPQLEQSWIDRYHEVATTGEPMRFENYNADTGRHYEVYSYRPEPGRFASLFRDVSERVRMAQALADSEQRYTALFNNRINGIAHLRVITDAEGQPADLEFEAVNDAYEAIVGLKKSDVVGRRMTAVFPGVEHMEPDLIGLYGRIGLQGGEDNIEVYFPMTRQWFAVYVYSHARGHCTLIFNDIDAQKRAEAEREKLSQRLQEAARYAEDSHAQLEAVLHAINEGIAVFDMKGELTLCNPVMTHSNYFPCVEDERRNFDYLSQFYELFLPDGEPLPREQWPIPRILRGESFSEWELRHRACETGAVNYFAYSGAPVLNASGQQTLAVLIIRNISERKKTEKALVASEAELHATFAQAGIGIARLGPDERFLKANPKFCELVGYTADELSQLHCDELTHPDDSDTTCTMLRRTLAGELPGFSAEKRYLHKNGGVIWVRITASPVRHPDSDEVLYAVKFVEDISERKRVRAELEGFFRQATVGMLVMDLKSIILRLNQRFADMLGYTQDELLATQYMAINHPDDLLLDKALFKRMKAGEIPEYTLEKRLLCKDGSFVWTLISATLVREAEAQPYVVLVTQDIEARKQLEAELLTAQRELEARVERRTQELRLAKRQAEEALSAAETANAAKTEFLATMSHEIRTPLNGVIGFTGLLLDGALTEEKRRYAELARQSGESLLHLLNDFLDFTKIEAGRLELEPVEFDLRQEARQLLALIQQGAQEKGLELRSNIEVPPRLRGDAARLRQILLNLLSNAVKFTHQGHITLCCTEASRQGTTVRICFEVTDTGIGIDRDTRERLFQPFTQGHDISRRFGGTGLGLAISRRLAEIMGGEIGFRSTLGEGSTFWVELPFDLLPSEDAPLSPDSADLLATLPEGAYRGRVLVVEDNSVSQLLAVEVLKRLGCQVDVAGNGREAIEAYKRLPYDLILMDCDMPIMDGFEATRHIRALEEGSSRHAGHPHVPIIAMTASALQGDPERCIAAGMDEFMSKPLRLQHLSKVIDTWLRHG